MEDWHRLLPKASNLEKERKYRELEKKLTDGALKVSELREAQNLISSMDYTRLLARLAEQHETLSMIDPLTETYNRRYLGLQLDKLLRDLNRDIDSGRKSPLKALMVIFVDIKEFKKLNDTKGHTAGDDALRKLANKLENALRSQDELFRFGGDEFVALLSLPIENPRTQEEIFSRIRKEVHESLPFRISMGSVVVEKGSGLTAEKILEIADKKMYEDKRGTKEEQLTLNLE